MVERKLYKTKLCLLYQRGRCSRQYCNFAHGDAELRRSFNGRQEFRGGGDLRERLDRMRSPPHESPGRRESRDAKARRSSHGDSPRSLGKRIDKNPRKRKQFDDHDDYSGRMSDGTEDQIKDRRLLFDEKLREIQSEIKLLENDKQRLEMYLEDKVKEAEALAFKNHELEMQLSKEKEEGKRLTSKIKKFIKAHNRHLRLQDEVKRSQAQLQKLGELLDLDVGGGNEEDLRIKALSDDVTGGFTSPLNEGQLNSSPRRKRSRFSVETQDTSNEVGGRTEVGKSRVEKPPRPSRNHEHVSNSKKPEADSDTYNSHRLSAHEEKSRRSSNQPADIASADKHKALETALTLPSTGIAAHALDEYVEVVETDGRFHTAAGPSSGQEDTTKTPRLPFLPPPPPFSQKEGDENVDVDGMDEETVEVDII